MIVVATCRRPSSSRGWWPCTPFASRCSPTAKPPSAHPLPAHFPVRPPPASHLHPSHRHRPSPAPLPQVMLSLVLSIVVERLEGRGQPLRKTAGWASYDSGEEDSDGDQAGPALLDAGLASLSLSSPTSARDEACSSAVLVARASSSESTALPVSSPGRDAGPRCSARRPARRLSTRRALSSSTWMARPPGQLRRRRTARLGPRNQTGPRTPTGTRTPPAACRTLRPARPASPRCRAPSGSAARAGSSLRAAASARSRPPSARR